jgi:hypothetical protein
MHTWSPDWKCVIIIKSHIINITIVLASSAIPELPKHGSNPAYSGCSKVTVLNLIFTIAGWSYVKCMLNFTLYGCTNCTFTASCCGAIHDQSGVHCKCLLVSNPGHYDHAMVMLA